MIARRRFLGLALCAAAGTLTSCGASRRTSGRASRTLTPVIEAIRTERPMERGLTDSDIFNLLDEIVVRLTDPDALLLDAWSTLIPGDSTVGIKVSGRSTGLMTARLALALAARARDLDLPAGRVVVWGRDAPSLKRAGLERIPGEVATAETGGASTASRFTRVVTVSALHARADGTMGPLAIENLAEGMAAPPAGGPPEGDARLAVRALRDEGLLERSSLHVADLWEVPLGRDAGGREVVWSAGSFLVSRDAVALTRVAWTILANARTGHGLGDSPEPVALREAARLGLGASRIAAGLAGPDSAAAGDIRWVKRAF